MVWGAVIAAGASLAGSALASRGASSANKKAAQEAQANRAFQEYMASTRYQRTMEDMRKAGLNPILAYKQGGGPGAPGAMYTPQNELAAYGEGMPRAVSSAIAARRADQELQNLKADETLKTGQKDLAWMQEQYWAANAEHMRQQIASARAQAVEGATLERFWRTPTGQELIKARAVQDKLGITGAGAVSMLAKNPFLKGLLGGGVVGAGAVASQPHSAKSMNRDRDVRGSQTWPWKGTRADRWRKQ